MNKEQLVSTILISIDKLEANVGQLSDVPANPRIITEERMEALKKSVSQLPDMLSLRELLVYPKEGRFVVLCGNQRLAVCKELEWKELPCKIIPQSTPAEKLRRITMLDNEPFGKTDWDMIVSDWNVEELQSWGIEVLSVIKDEWDNIPYINEEQKEPVLDKPIKIVVSVPFEELDIVDEIRDKIKGLLEEYPNVLLE